MISIYFFPHGVTTQLCRSLALFNPPSIPKAWVILWFCLRCMGILYFDCYFEIRHWIILISFFHLVFPKLISMFKCNIKIQYTLRELFPLVFPNIISVFKCNIEIQRRYPAQKSSAESEYKIRILKKWSRTPNYVTTCSYILSDAFGGSISIFPKTSPVRAILLRK